MTNFKSFLVDRRGNQFLTGELAYGNPLAQLLVRSIDFNSGQVYAIAQETAHGDLYQFKRSIFPTADIVHLESSRVGRVIPKSDTDAWIVDWLSRELGSNDVFAAESFMVRTTYSGYDKYVASAKAKIKTFAPYVYCLTTKDGPTGALLDTLGEVHRQPMGFGVVSEVTSSSEWLSAESTVGQSSLEELTRGLRYVLLGAYDGESCLVWKRRAGTAVHPT